MVSFFYIYNHTLAMITPMEMTPYKTVYSRFHKMFDVVHQLYFMCFTSHSHEWVGYSYRPPKIAGLKIMEEGCK